MQPEKLAVLGRLTEISLAELIARYGKKVSRINKECALVSTSIDLPKLGGCLKVGRIVDRLPESADLAKTLAWHPLLTERLKDTGKTSIGISWYGPGMTPTKLNRLGIQLKNHLRERASIRIVPNRANHLTAAQITHNKLLDKGIELVLAAADGQIVLAITEEVQDIDSYSSRDYGRPQRASRVGMLPPKLAQIMINLAQVPSGKTILDPFCGSGVVLQESLLMGYPVIGSDLTREMVKASRANLEWLSEEGQLPDWRVSQIDATKGGWESFYGVVTEGYLGPPLSSPPTPKRLDRLKKNAAELTLSFLSNLRSQISEGIPVVMTLPAWRQGKEYRRIEIIDQILSLGYSRRQFPPVKPVDLLYMRPGQTVAREIIVLRSK
jgi:tRNA G10  N-methylase Trm11